MKILATILLIASCAIAGQEKVLFDSSGCVVQWKCRYDTPFLDTITLIFYHDGRYYASNRGNLKGVYPANDYAFRIINWDAIVDQAIKETDSIIKIVQEDLRKLNKEKAE